MNAYNYHLFAVASHVVLLAMTGGLSAATLMYLNIIATICAAVALLAGGGLAFVAAPSRAETHPRKTFSALYLIYFVPAGALALYCAIESLLGWLVAFKLSTPIWTDPLRSSRLAAMGMGLVSAVFSIIFFINLWMVRRLVPPETGVLE